MANFDKRDRREGGRPNFRGGGRDSGPQQLFDATCSHCGKACKVPFRPTGDKPVYCRDCFVQGGHDQERGERQDRGGREGGKDRFDKPRFEKSERSEYVRPTLPPASSANDEIKRQLENVNANLVRLISAFQALGTDLQF